MVTARVLSYKTLDKSTVHWIYYGRSDTRTIITLIVFVVIGYIFTYFTLKSRYHGVLLALSRMM